MITIQQAAAAFAPSATSATGNLSVRRQRDADNATNIAVDRSTISQDARDRLLAEAANGASVQSSGTYRVDGPFYRVEDLVKSKGEPLLVIKLTDAQASEVKLREEQDAAREAINFDYAKAHQYQPVGQVLVNGKLVATVFDRGAVESPHALPGLSSQDLSAADRLAEIARAVKGEIIYSDLLPTMGGWMGASAPESALPPVTARNLMDILQQEIVPAMEQKIAEWEAQTGKTYPRHP